jgi:DNA mismatch repair protein MutL
MAPRIQQLPDDLIARIAAGEVVERPASVVKELMENSLDAGADSISVVIEGAGRKKISISDNGSGMSREDALLSIRRHATSKISKYDDLENIATYGFRGEALPSIASVSRFKLTTRCAEDENGWEFVWEGGKLVSEKPVGRDVGTTIEVCDLFFNTPARFKFLKSDPTERAQCLRVIEEMVFSSLHATISVRTDDARPIVFRHSPESSHDVNALQSRVTEAWGIRWARSLEKVASETPHFRLWGVVTNQASHQATARNQFLFINKRPVQNRRLSRAIYDAFRGQLPSMRHPAWVLFLEVQSNTVDVNVHPAKREVKLTHESEIYGFMLTSVQRALSKTQEIPTEFFSPKEAVFVAPSAPLKPAIAKPAFTSTMSSSLAPMAPVIEALYKPLPVEKVSFNFRADPLHAMAQVGATYIVAQTADGLVLVDQHAAAEKVIYERLFANLKTKQPQTQMLLVPFTWDVSLSVASSLKERIPDLAAFGFVIEPFGGSTYLVKGIPPGLSEKTDLPSLLDALTDTFSGTDQVQHRLAAATACKAAVKAGDILDLKECQKLLEDLATLEAPLTCPHGRPTMITLPFTDLAHRFRRT